MISALRLNVVQVVVDLNQNEQLWKLSVALPKAAQDRNSSQVVANAVRAVARLLETPEIAVQFQQYVFSISNLF